MKLPILRHGFSASFIVLVSFAVSGCSPEMGAGFSLPSDMRPEGNRAFAKPIDSCGPVEPIGSSLYAGAASMMSGGYFDDFQFNPALPRPGKLKVVGDDHRARLIWDGGGGRNVHLWNATSNPAWNEHGRDQVRQGYWIEIYDRESGVLVRTARTVHREMDIQSVYDGGVEVPLSNEKEYEALVYSVDSYGRVSEPSEPLVLKADAGRIDRLRELCTNFFDDFNLSAGAFDERKWNFSVGINNGERFNGAFINTQFHAHTTVSTEGHDPEWDAYNDRSRVFSRPRSLIDLSGGATRRILFNMDGTRGNRDIWYFDIYPAAVNHGRLDANGRESADILDPGTKTGAYPGSFIRITTGGTEVGIEHFGPKGVTVNSFFEGEWDREYFLSRSEAGIPFVPNVQRFWEIEISKERIDLYIDGRWMKGGPLNLGPEFDQAQTAWVGFSYNTAKDEENRVQLVHWDNFCMDGPKANDRVTHNYKMAMTSVGGLDRVNGGSQPTVEIQIPDEIAGATQAYVMFTLHPYGFRSGYTWSASQYVEVNGTKINFPDPYVAYTNITDPVESGRYAFIGPNSQFPVVLPVSPSLLRQGNNSLKFDIPVDLNNIHVELDFPKELAPAYTQPYEILGAHLAAGSRRTHGMPEFWMHGPRLMYVDIGQSKNVSIGNIDKIWSLAGGVNEITVRIDHEPMVLSTGGNPGVSKAQLLIDGQVYQELRLDRAVATPLSFATFEVDLSPFADGQTHTFRVIGISGDGLKSYFASTAMNTHVGIENHEQFGDDNPPLKFRISD